MDVLDPMFPVQVRATRVLLGWTQKELAREVGVSEPFIARLERGDRLGQGEKLAKLRDALLDLGVEFSSDHDGFGLRLTGHKARQRRRDLRRREHRGGE